MIKNIKKLIFIATFFFVHPLSAFADDARFIDFNKVLNVSKVGAEAQKKLKQKFKS